MNTKLFLLLNLALAFYEVGVVWAHEIDIFRSWKLLDADTFHRVQSDHWRKLPYWVLVPFALSLVGSIALVWYHPPATPMWAIRGSLASQLAAHVTTAVVWAPWQAKLSRDPCGPESVYLSNILKTHWVRTALVTAYGFILFAWTIRAMV